MKLCGARGGEARRYAPTDESAREQRFIDINVSETGQKSLIEQQRFDLAIFWRARRGGNLRA